VLCAGKKAAPDTKRQAIMRAGFNPRLVVKPALETADNKPLAPSTPKSDGQAEPVLKK
jgi:hypothetical protein